LFAVAQPQGVKITKSNTWQKTKILFIVDCSQSMKFKWQSDTKIKITQTLLSNIADSLKNREDVELALRTFGSNENENKETCSDSFLDVPFAKNNFEVFKSKLKAMLPKGSTPLAYSLGRAEEDFPDCDNCRNIVILITDGLDDCNENPCEVSQTLQKNGKIITPFIISLGASLRTQLECIGHYFEPDNEIEYTKDLYEIISRLLDKTTCQVNLLDAYMEANETNVPITFYDHQSGQPKYNYMHTFNEKGLSDTLILDPLVDYDLVVHTIPNVKLENIKLLPAKHTIIPLQVPQGTLIVKFVTKDKSSAKTFPVIIRKHKGNETVNVQPMNKPVKYIVGIYDIDVLTIPLLHLDSIEISQSATTTIEIPQTGNVQINKPSNMLGSLFVKEGGQMRLICELDADLPTETISLLPGEYVAILRPRKSTHTLQTITKEFKIVSSQTTTITLQEPVTPQRKR
jgi:Ca-activated chloride channel family protein